MNSLKNHLKHSVENELKLKNKTIETVFIGGGTPSSILALEYKEIFEIIQPYLEENAEITVEANPNSATQSWLETMFFYGANRVSFGVQSFNDEKLKFLGRAHNATKAKEAIVLAKEVGYKRINCDLIYGVLNDTFESIQKDIDIINTLPIDHVSAYSLTIEEGTKFFAKSSVKIDDEELSGKIFSYLEKSGFKQYEISNFAKEEASTSKHNIGYWQHKEYLGVGAGAVGYIAGQRLYPQKDLEKYIQNPFENEIEVLSHEEIKTEKILLGLRSLVGIELSLFNEKENHKVMQLVEYEKIYIKNDRVYSKDFLLADELALYILE